MLAAIVQIRVEGLSETAAHDALIEGINTTRAKPSARPLFPGVSISTHRDFPGAGSSSQVAKLIPVLKKEVSDIDKRRFVNQVFDQVKELFEENLKSATVEYPELETDFSVHTSSEFRAEIFLAGKSKCKCRIWKNGMHFENNICYSEGSALMGDGCNEILGIVHDDGLYMSAQMAFASHKLEALDLKKLTPEKSAEYLWLKFVEPLER